MENPSDRNKARLLLVAETLRNVPDRLVAVQFDLWPLCHGDMLELPPRAHQNITEACKLVRSAIADTMIALECIQKWLREQQPSPAESLEPGPLRLVSVGGARGIHRPHRSTQATLYAALRSDPSSATV